MTVFICQNSQYYILKRVNFTVCKLFLNKTDFRKKIHRLTLPKEKIHI